MSAQTKIGELEVTALLCGDAKQVEQGFELIYQEFGKGLRGEIVFIAPSLGIEDRDDIFQEAMLRFVKRVRSGAVDEKERKHWLPLLRKIVRDRAIDVGR